jgi:acyl-CoA thioester hydrolase
LSAAPGLTDRRPPFRFAHTMRVGFDETDAQGIVYYGRYMPYFDRARVEYLRELSLLAAHGAQGDFVMRAQAVEYHAPGSFDDELEVYVRVTRVGTSSVSWGFAAYDARTGDLLATASQTMVHIDLESRRPAPVPDDYRRRVGAFERAPAP